LKAELASEQKAFLVGRDDPNQGCFEIEECERYAERYRDCLSRESLSYQVGSGFTVSGQSE
jgi:hypothetical protein